MIDNILHFLGDNYLLMMFVSFLLMIAWTFECEKREPSVLQFFAVYIVISAVGIIPLMLYYNLNTLGIFVLLLLGWGTIGDFASSVLLGVWQGINDETPQ